MSYHIYPSPSDLFHLVINVHSGCKDEKQFGWEVEDPPILAEAKERDECSLEILQFSLLTHHSLQTLRIVLYRRK